MTCTLIKISDVWHLEIILTKFVEALAPSCAKRSAAILYSGTCSLVKGEVNASIIFIIIQRVFS